MAEPRDEQAPFAYAGLDRVLHEKARLGILTALASHAEGVSFVALKGLCNLTDGNLARHLQVLEECGLVSVRKKREGRRSVSSVRLLAEGRRQFERYLEELERVIRDARQAEAAPAARRRPGLSTT